MPRRPNTSPNTSSRRAIRHEYESRGVDGFYRARGATYRNPHEPQVRRAVGAAVDEWRLDLSRVLDLAAGSGEATLALRELGAKHVEATDPYTAAAYAARTGAVAETLSFEDVAAGALGGRHYSLVVCSFALHLCTPSRLPAVAQQLAMAADALLVLTPHKRPVIRAEWGWRLEGERVVERVRARCYRSAVAGGGS